MAEKITKLNEETLLVETPSSIIASKKSLEDKKASLEKDLAEIDAYLAHFK